MMFVVPGNLSRRYFHVLRQGDHRLDLHIHVTMTASVADKGDERMELVGVTARDAMTTQKMTVQLLTGDRSRLGLRGQ